MSTKENSKCLQNVKDDEPIFVLRAQDRFAPMLVKQWAMRLLQEIGKADTENDAARIQKAREALKCADEMEMWAEANGNKIPD